MNVIAATARWVHPEVFHALPVWRPDTARGLPLLKADWKTRQTNNEDPKSEGNVAAQTSLMAALGVIGKKPTHWTTCHIWGYDDPKFASKGWPVNDRRFFSCVGNMVLLPTPLKGFTDAVPIIKRHLRVCAYQLYGWICDHPMVATEAAEIRLGNIPEGYPGNWPTAERKTLPPGTGPINDAILKKLSERKRHIAKLLDDESLVGYPRDEVRAVLEYWYVVLPDVTSATRFFRA